jgi:hypothetical protein
MVKTAESPPSTDTSGVDVRVGVWLGVRVGVDVGARVVVGVMVCVGSGVFGSEHAVTKRASGTSRNR